MTRIKKKKLSKSIRKYIRHQKMLIKGSTKDGAEEKRLVKELLGRFYK